MEAAFQGGATKKLRHLAGQRLADLISVVDDHGGTTKQHRAFAEALDGWKAVEPKRQFPAHGIASVSTDARGCWTLLLDVVVYRQNCPISERWAIKEGEAEEFLAQLEEAFKRMSGQLGHFRKRIAG